MSKRRKNNANSRLEVIKAVKSFLSYFVLATLVVEGALGAVALKAEGNNQFLTIAGMIVIFLVLIFTVSYFIIKKPDILLATKANQVKLNVFADSISGYWWQSLEPATPCAISFVEIRKVGNGNSFKLKGKAYNNIGEPVTFWDTESAFVDFSQNKIIYAWQRNRYSKKYEPYEGFGEITFHHPAGVKASGFFLDTKSLDASSAKKYITEYWRPTDEQINKMNENNEKNISELISELVKC